MGAWGYGIFDNDTALDIQDEFNDYIEEGLSSAEATERIIKEYGDDEDDSITAYLVVASLQIQSGKLQADIKQGTLDIIENERGLEIWEEAGEETLKARKKALEELRIKLLKN